MWNNVSDSTQYTHSSAFDSITPHHIQCSLRRIGADPGVVGWYDDYLLHRNMTYYHGHHKMSCTTDMGFPRGECAPRPSGPLLLMRRFKSSMMALPSVSLLLTTVQFLAADWTRPSCSVGFSTPSTVLLHGVPPAASSLTQPRHRLFSLQEPAPFPPRPPCLWSTHSLRPLRPVSWTYPGPPSLGA